MQGQIINQRYATNWPFSSNYDMINNSSILNSFNSTDFSSLLPESGLTEIDSSRSYVWVVPMLTVYLLSYILQLGFLGRGVTICYQLDVGWLFRWNQRGLILPNTRFLISLWNIIFVTIQFTDTIFLVMGAVGPTLVTERYRISGFVWYTLWLSGWTLSWGIATCCFVIAYQKGGFIGRMVSIQVTSKIFNAFFISGVILITITHIGTFGLIVAQQLAMTSEKGRLSQLSGTSFPDAESRSQQYTSSVKLESLSASFWKAVQWIFYVRLGWSVLMLVLLVPLGISLIKMLQNLKSTKDSDTPEPSLESPHRKASKTILQIEPLRKNRSSSDIVSIHNPSNKSVHLGSKKSGTITNVSLVVLHILIYVLVVIGFAPAFQSSHKDIQDKAKELKQLAYLSKGLYAIAGLWSGWIFLRLTREMESEKKVELDRNLSISTNRGSSPDHPFDQLSSYRFPVNKASVTPP